MFNAISLLNAELDVSAAFHAFVVALCIVLTYMVLWFIVALIRKRNDVADIAWGLGFVLLAWTLAFLYENFSLPMIVVLACVTVWGLRLSSHIYMRNKNKPEDFRYAKWREEWGVWLVPRAFLQIFVLQGLLLTFISMPFVLLAAFGSDVSFSTYPSLVVVLMVLGALTWIKGFFFESVGDAELKTFIQNSENKGKLLTTGLFAYTRHPNYFGEVLQWWGIYILSAATLFAATTSWIFVLVALIGPLTITFLILKVSGIPLLEKKYEGRADFEAYKRRTNAFFPWFPRKD